MFFRNVRERRVDRIHQNGHTRELGHHAEQQLQLLGADVAGEVREPGDVPSRPRQAFDKAAADRVAGGCHDDRNRGGCFLKRADGLRGSGNNHVHFQPHQFCRQVGKALAPVVKAPLDHQILALNVAELAHSPREGTDEVGVDRVRATTLCQEADAPDLVLLLSVGDQRGRTERKECENRVTPVHSNPVKRRSHRLDAQRSS